MRVNRPAEPFDSFASSRQNLWHKTANHFGKGHQCLLITLNSEQTFGESTSSAAASRCLGLTSFSRFCIRSLQGCGDELPFGGTKHRLANFHLFLERIPEDKLIWKPTTCSCSNLEGKIRSLRLIPSNLQVIYHLLRDERSVCFTENAHAATRRIGASPTTVSNRSRSFSHVDWCKKPRDFPPAFTPLAHNTPLQERFLRWPMGVLLMIRGKCSHFRAKPAHFSGHLPLTHLKNHFR